MGSIFNIQKFCINDGPGIRTTVFLKGCPLKCIWCHNPESQKIKPELMYAPDKCVGCLRCTRVCPTHSHVSEDGRHVFARGSCAACGKCSELHCNALELFGREASVDEIIKEVLKDKLFYETSGGGMTISGGEPLAQLEFTLELLKAAKHEGLHTAVETCGYAPAERMAEVAEYTDLFLFDFKHFDPETHRELTGVDNVKILENLHLLDSLGKDIVLRCPIIPGINDNDTHFAAIAALADATEHILRVELEPYHSFGESKYNRLERDYALAGMKLPENEVIDGWLATLRRMTKKEVKKA